MTYVPRQKVLTTQLVAEVARFYRFVSTPSRHFSLEWTGGTRTCTLVSLGGVSVPFPVDVVGLGIDHGVNHEFHETTVVQARFFVCFVV